MAMWLHIVAIATALALSANAASLGSLMGTQASRCTGSPGATEATRIVSLKYWQDAQSRNDVNKDNYILANESDSPAMVTNGCPIYFGMMHDETIYVNMIRDDPTTDLFIGWSHDGWYTQPSIHFKNGGGQQWLSNIRIHGQDVWTMKRRGWFFEQDGVDHYGANDPFEVKIFSGYEGNSQVRFEGHWTFAFYDTSHSMRQDQYDAIKAFWDSTCMNRRSNVAASAALDFDFSGWCSTSTCYSHDLPVCLWMEDGWNHTLLSANNYAEACLLMDFVECDADGYVTHMYVGGSGLKGTVPTAMTALSRLVELYIELNQLSGPVPDMFENHPALREVSMYRNFFTGPLPSFTGDANLELLWMEVNKFTGTVPSSVTMLTNLGSLWFDHNEITGTIPDLAALTKLTHLYMGTNHMTGTVPSTLCGLTSLTFLEMAYNKFRGQWPQACINPTTDHGWKRLYYLDVAHNRFSGSIPKFSDAMIQLVRIDISYNSYEGSLTDQFHVVLHNAVEHSNWYTELYATGNLLSGEFPQFAYNMTYNAERVDRFSITDNLFRCENNGRLPVWTVRASFSEHGTCVPVPNPTSVTPTVGMPGTIVVVDAVDIVPSARPRCKFYKDNSNEQAIAGGSVIFDMMNPGVAPQVRCHVPAALAKTTTETYKVTVANFGEDFATAAYWQGATGVTFSPPSFEVTAIETMDQGVVVTTTVTLVGVTPETFNEPAFRQMIAELAGVSETDVILHVGADAAGTRRLVTRMLRFRMLQTTMDVEVDINLPAANPSSEETVAEVSRVKAILADSTQVEEAMARYGFDAQNTALEVEDEQVALQGTIVGSSTETTKEENLGLGLAIAAVGICLVCCLCGFLCFLRYREKKGQPYFQETLDEGGGAGGNYSGATYGNTA